MQEEILKETAEKEAVMKEAIQFFKSDEGFMRLFEKMKRKLESYEREATGVAVIDNPTLAEREALSGFMKKNYYRSKVISIKIGRFQLRLNETRFAGIKVKELVEKYFGLEILTKKTRKEMLLIELQEFLDEVLKEINGTRAYYIVKSIMDENTEDFRMLKMEYKSSKKELKNALKNACIAINHLPNEKLSIPVFAANVLKNPHELDRGNLTNKIFILMLSKEAKTSKPQNTEELLEFYFQYNLLVDDLSNMVLCKNIIGMIGEKEHSGWKGFFEHDEAMQITLAQLAKITKVYTLKKSAIIVENPAVFSALARLNLKIPLVCTYGQIKLSGIVLLNLLVENKVKLYYSGDIDPEGIQIADHLKKRYGEKLQLVGFDTSTYMKNLSKVRMSEQRIKKLDKIRAKELVNVSYAVSEMKVAAYEEENLDAIMKLAKELDEEKEKQLV